MTISPPFFPEGGKQLVDFAICGEKASNINSGWGCSQANQSVRLLGGEEGGLCDQLPSPPTCLSRFGALGPLVPGVTADRKRCDESSVRTKHRLARTTAGGTMIQTAWRAVDVFL